MPRRLHCVIFSEVFLLRGKVMFSMACVLFTGAGSRSTLNVIPSLH